MRPDPATMSDAELITAVRDGDTEAYGVLYERHLHAAKRAALCLAHTAAEREDLVADAFLRVLRALRDGGGPNEEFRAYLLVTMRNAAVSKTRGASVASYADVPEQYIPRPATGDPVVDQWNAMTVASAFATLPERWRTVLWHTEVEEETPAEVAPLLGMRPNGVAALAYRAREGLRQAYLRAHLPEVETRECRVTVSKLAGWVRHSVPVPLGRKISRHLAVCSDCRERADTLSRVNEELRASIASALLGAAFAAAYAPVATPVKSVLAKVGVAVAIAATAVTVGVSGPDIADPVPHSVPVVVQPALGTGSFEGPAHDADRHLPNPGAPVTGSTTVPATPEPATPEPPDEIAAVPAGVAENEKDAEPKAGKDATKADKKATKAAQGADKDTAKDAAKADRKADEDEDAAKVSEEAENAE